VETTPPPYKPRVFISYARKDGQAAATSLRQRLTEQAPELHPWMDHHEMVGGRSWWLQITEAIDSSRVLVLVMTPAAFRSEVVRREWQYARQRGVAVYPVKGIPDAQIDYASLPGWMSKSHLYDVEDGKEEWHTFLRHLRSPPTPVRVPFMAPDLPDGFVRRPAEFDRLLSHLLERDRGAPVAITAAVQGAGGFGKTTLAAALAHHDDVVTAFDDGILWVTLGEKPNVLDSLAKLHAVVTGERSGFVDTEDAVHHLAERLGDRNCLIIIDDVWNRAHLEPFLKVGRRCAHLFTTRDFGIAAAARRVNVDAMTPDESAAVLVAAFPERPADVSPFRALAARLGEWALLLALAAAVLRDRLARGDTPAGALVYLNRALDARGVAAFDQRDPVERRQAVSRTIDVSLSLLTARERVDYLRTAIFPEDVDVPFSTLSTLWGMDAFGAEEFAQQLANLSLVKLSLQTGTIRVHDVFRAYLIAQSPDLAAVHAALVAGWGNAHQLPDSDAWRWIGYHLDGAKRLAELRQLLFDFSWLQAKLDHTDPAALVADFDFLRDDADAALLQAALRLSSHVLARDKEQLTGQLIARLLPQPSTAIQSLLEQARVSKLPPWLCPLRSPLSGPGGPLLRTLAGHSGPVSAVAVTPEGRLAVSGSDDKTLKVWDLATGAEVRTLAGHDHVVCAVAVTPDGRLAVSGSYDKTLKVWDLATGAELLTLAGHAHAVTAAALAPDGRLAVSASGDEALKVWDLATGTEIRTLPGHVTGWMGTAVAVTLGGRLVSGSWDHKLKVRDTATGGEVRTLAGHASEVLLCTVWGVAVTPDARVAVSGSQDQTLKVWDLESGVEVRTMAGHANGVVAVAVTPDGRLAVSGSGDRTLKVWDLATGAEVRTLAGHSGHVTAVAVTPDGRLAVSGSDDKTLKVWNLANKGTDRTVTGHSSAVVAVALTPDGRLALSGSEDTTLKVWDLPTGAEVRTLAGHSSHVRAVAVTPDGRLAVSASFDSTLKVWDLATGAEVRTLAGRAGGLNSVAVTPDGRQAVSGLWDHTLKVWDLATGAEVRTLVGHAKMVMAVAVTPDGRLAISGSADETLKVWDLATGAEVGTLAGHAHSVKAVAVTPDGRLAVSGSDDKTLKVWDLATGAEVRTLTGHANGVTAVAVTPDGRQAVSGSYDDTLKVWDLATGRCVASFIGDSCFNACVVAPNGVTVVAGDHAGGVHMFRLVLAPFGE
jgi:WD40 repeat protein